MFEPAKDIPDLRGKVIMVTGGNAGIGKATISAIARHHPDRVYLCARRRSEAETAAAELQVECNYNNIVVLDLDLAHLESVKKCADDFIEREDRLDILFLNAGVANTPPALTRNGYEYQLGINHLGHALLAQLLMPKMLQTQRCGENTDVRIVATSSNAAFAPFLPKGGLALNAMRKPDTYGPMGLYAHSKLANILFIRKLAQLYPQITAVAVHPGTVKSDIWSKEASGLASVLFKPIFWATSVTTDQGAKSQLWAATAKLGGTNGVITGHYYEPVGRAKVLKGAAANQDLVDKLWEWTEKELTKYGGGWSQL